MQEQALNKLNMDIDEYLPVAGLPVGYMQFIEIAREIDKDKLKTTDIGRAYSSS